MIQGFLGTIASKWFQVGALGCLVTAFRNALMRAWPIVYSWKAPSLYVHFGLTVVMMACFGYAFKNADTFFRMWFIGSGLLAVFGWAISLFFFKDPITFYQALGAAAIVVGTIFIGK